MQAGNDKSFALYDPVTGIVRDDLTTSDDLGDLFPDLDSSVVELLEEELTEKKIDDAEDLAELDLGPRALDKSNDSVRVYLREMGMVPLLTREGEIELAKRIERGQTAVAKALSRSRLIIRKLLELREEVERGKLSPLGVPPAPDTQSLGEEEDLSAPLREQYLTAMVEIEKLYRRAQAIEQRLISGSRGAKPKQQRKLRYQHMRLIVLV